ncbi:MAG TPA: diacylglycerol kinase family protein [Isosphaeraceae bacterium]|jgi:YegS/Rv2252/BmrU family lipid kinase|nr:diacylglycerol kinase family protein [Isosphaeraceae bacterium]
MAGDSATGTAVAARRVFVVLNPAAGTCTADDVREALGRYFSCEQGACDIHETTARDDLSALVREAAARGCDLVVAAGGDGTVSVVADGVTGTETPLGIIPLGTANVLARELGVPVVLDDACRLLAGPLATTAIDAMVVGERSYLTQVGVGIDALMIRDTGRDQKRRLGRLAYLWTAALHLIGFEPRRFSIAVDGHPVERTRASQVVVANSATLGQHPFRWGPDIRPDDGRVDVCVVRARSLIDYINLAWYVLMGQHRRSPHVRYLYACRSATIGSDRPLPVQADGEIIGETPVEVRVAVGAVRVVTPPPEARAQQ